MLPQLGGEFGGYLTPDCELLGDHRGEAVVVDHIREDAKHRLGFFKNISRRFNYCSEGDGEAAATSFGSSAAFSAASGAINKTAQIRSS